MNCVFYENKQPNGFEEQFSYSPEMPYTIYIKDFPSTDLVPLHYAKTVEILICKDLVGDCVIDGIRYDLSGRHVFVIPPYTVHSTTILPCEGIEYVFCISLPDMEHYFNLPNYLLSCGCSLACLAHEIAEYDKIQPIIARMIERQGEVSLCLPDIIALFQILSDYTIQSGISDVPRQHNSVLLQNIVRWTQENYMNAVSLEDAAQVVGYSKSYFCACFKKLTGITYGSYLNLVRIQNACLFLRQGLPVQVVSTMCGLENPSYFTQVFRKVKHITPRQYISQYERRPL